MKRLKSPIPTYLEGATVVAVAPLGNGVSPTGNCRHPQPADPLRTPEWLAICEGGGRIVLLGLDASWSRMTRTLHPTLEDAYRQAEFEYRGISSCWTLGDSEECFRRPYSERLTQEGVLWAGFFFAPFGYAKMNRELVTRLALRLKLRVLPEAGDWAPNVELSPNISDFIDPVMPRDLLLVRGSPPRKEATGAYRVCYTMMETLRIHPDFIRALNSSYDECWTPTRWNAEVFQAGGLDIPVRVMPLGVDPRIFHPRPGSVLPQLELLTTSRAGIREVPKGFTFMSLFQYSFRKGPEFLVDCFNAAFAEDPDTALVLATTARPLSAAERKILLTGVRARIYELPGVFSETRLAELYSACRAYVSASRGEGWNLPACEAAACGLPVLIPRHTAHPELFPESLASFYGTDGEGLVEGSGEVCRWFQGQPFAVLGKRSKDELVARMRRLRANAAAAQQTGRQLAVFMHEQRTWDRASTAVLAALGATSPADE